MQAVPTTTQARPDADAIVVDELRRSYGNREALGGVSFTVRRGEIFGMLGPNGGGKTTLFRILSTLLAPSGGSARVFGNDVVADQAAVRTCLGVVFQQPSLDPKLTVSENLRHHGHLYGMHGRPLRAAVRAMVERLDLVERLRDRAETLSGGMQRRVELAMGLLHNPRLLLLDEPSTGLDPRARRELVSYLAEIRRELGVTVALTTHILGVAERCDRVGILDRGRLVACDAPAALKTAIGGDVVVIHASDPRALSARIRSRLQCDPTLVGDAIRIEHQRGHELVRDVVEAFPGQMRSITFGPPTLEDVFIQRTGHHFDGAEPA